MAKPKSTLNYDVGTMKYLYENNIAIVDIKSYFNCTKETVLRYAGTFEFRRKTVEDLLKERESEQG